jgi:hypothetical protein
LEDENSYKGNKTAKLTGQDTGGMAAALWEAGKFLSQIEPFP